MSKAKAGMSADWQVGTERSGEIRNKSEYRKSKAEKRDQCSATEVKMKYAASCSKAA
jgi:hypothetical protein